MNTNLTAGYNPLMAEVLLASVRSNYSEFKDGANKLNSEYINVLAESWYSQEIYDYFNDIFKPKMDEIYSDMYSLTNASLEKISNAQKAWAGLTNTTDDTGTNMLDDEISQCDVSAIKAQQDNGDRGLDISEVEALTTVLNSCFEAQIQSISKMEKSVKGNEFVGGDQTEELLSRFKKIRKKLTTLLDSTKKDIDDHINKAINEYLGLETNTSNKFSIDGKNVDFSRITNNSADSLNGKFWSEDNIHKNRWGDNKSGKLEYEIKEDGSVLITEDGVAMGWTDKKGLMNAMSKEKDYISLPPGPKPELTPTSTPTPTPTPTPTSQSPSKTIKFYSWEDSKYNQKVERYYDTTTGTYYQKFTGGIIGGADSTITEYTPTSKEMEIVNRSLGNTTNTSTSSTTGIGGGGRKF